MPSEKRFPATDREKWRAWLATNYSSETEIWVVFQKKHTGKLGMSYEESVEEALCFGWIDSIVKRLDENTYTRKFTPRINVENWSELNKKRVAKCIQDGRMTEIGLAKISYPDPGVHRAAGFPVRKTTRKPLSVPGFMARGLRRNAKAWQYFNSLPPSHQRAYIQWVTMAKRDETRERRLAESIQLLGQKKRLGPK
jgi:uncharacterized protein YdeI (YjbR/CyaY-like superfamily)